MTIYGTTAKVIGMYKLYFNHYSTTKHIIVAKTDLEQDKYITIILEYCNGYVNFGRYGILFTSMVDMEIKEEKDIDELIKNITHFTINDHYLDLISVVKYSKEEIHELKCDIFEISRYGNKEEYKIEEFRCPKGWVYFNEDLFIDNDNKKNKKKKLEDF